jgi:hypothetical protein
VAPQGVGVQIPPSAPSLQFLIERYLSELQLIRQADINLAGIGALFAATVMMAAANYSVR